MPPRVSLQTTAMRTVDRMYSAPMRFEGTLFRYPGPGAWHFVKVPARLAPPATHRWGRTPVRATVDGHTWDTSVWKDKTHGTLLAVPRRVRGEKGPGARVQVELLPRKG